MYQKSVPPGGQQRLPASQLRRVNSLVNKQLSEQAPLGTDRAPLTAMNFRSGSTSVPSFARSALPAIVGLMLSAGLAQAQRPVPQRPQPTRPQPTQQSQGGREQIVPPGFFPPAGMCRIWINGVPAGQQPAPTDCASAVRNRPANARVLFGDDPPKKGKSDKKKSSPAGELIDLINRRISR